MFYNKYNLFMIKHTWITHLSIIPFIKCILVFMIKWSSWIFVHVVLSCFFLLLWCCKIRIRMYETNTSVVTWVMPWYCVQTLERVHYGGRTVSPVFRTFFFCFSESIHTMTQNRKPTGVERFTLICLNMSSNILIWCSYKNIEVCRKMLNYIIKPSPHHYRCFSSRC